MGILWVGSVYCAMRDWLLPEWLVSLSWPELEVGHPILYLQGRKETGSW